MRQLIYSGDFKLFPWFPYVPVFPPPEFEFVAAQFASIDLNDEKTVKSKRYSSTSAMEAENRHLSAAGTTPSLDYINDLPPELLLMVFDYCDFGTRRTVSKVCPRWSAILSNYPSTGENQMIWLFQDLLRPYASENKIRGYRNVMISRHGSCGIMVELLKDYLFNEDLVENLVELSINQVLYKFEGKTEMYLPNLRTLRITYDAEERPANDLPPLRYKIIAPKLRTFHQNCGEIREPLLMCSEQINTLIIDVRETTDLLSVMGNSSFANVGNLTLKVSEGCFQETDFNVELRSLFGGLHYLEVDWRFDHVLSFIIGEAKNVRSLKIYPSNVNESLLRQINKLKRLETLTLKLASGGRAIETGLSNPNLVKLITNVNSLGNLPCLTSLELVSSKEPTNSFFRPVADQLKSLRLLDVFLDRIFIDGICSLINLSTLKIDTIKGSPTEFEELLRRLSKLKAVNISRCELRTTSCQKIYPSYFCGSTSDDPEYEKYVRHVRQQADKARDLFRSFIEKLLLQYVDCAIAVDSGILWD